MVVAMPYNFLLTVNLDLWILVTVDDEQAYIIRPHIYSDAMNVINLIKHFILPATHIFSYKWPPWVDTSIYSTYLKFGP